MFKSQFEVEIKLNSDIFRTLLQKSSISDILNSFLDFQTIKNLVENSVTLTFKDQTSIENYILLAVIKILQFLKPQAHYYNTYVGQILLANTNF